MSQVSFGALAHMQKKKVTRREIFLGDMDEALPWSALEKLIMPVYPKAGAGRHPLGLNKLLRIYFMQQWFQLGDLGMEEALYDSESMWRFAGIDLGSDAVPDETTILNFRHLLETHHLTKAIFAEVGRLLGSRGLLVHNGSIVDATIIAAPPSTKNRARKRDPEMKSTKKGNQWHFGMKAHIGADTKAGLVHGVVCTPANVHDSQVMDDLLHGEETQVYGDKAYSNQALKQEFTSLGIAWHVCRKGTKAQPLKEADEAWNRRQSKVRARGEHAFGVVKNLWKYRKVRYRGLEKNAAQIFTLFALANVYMVRHELIAAGRQAICT